MVLFSKFGKTVQDLFKKSKYELNRTVSIKNNAGSTECTTEIGFPMTEEEKTNSKVLLKYTDEKLGTAEIDVSRSKPNKLDYQLPSLMEGLKVNLEIQDIETNEPGDLGIDLGVNLSATAEYQKGNLAGKICAKVGEKDRLTAEGAGEVYGVWLGGEAVLSTENCESHKVGGHYQLGGDTQIDVTLENLNKLDVKIHKQYSDTGEVAVEYELDKKDEIGHVFTLGGRWKLDDKCTTQGFFNTQGNTYLLYKHKLSERVTASLGTSFNVCKLGDENVNVHYKLEMEA